MLDVLLADNSAIASAFVSNIILVVRRQQLPKLIYAKVSCFFYIFCCVPLESQLSIANRQQKRLEDEAGSGES
jgi:hypothetical protein